MQYLYYPGCSLEGTAREYDLATRALLTALEVELTELEEWTCCGASAAEASSRLLSIALPARNLAIAAAMQPGWDLLVPCSACYLNLKRAAVSVSTDPEMAAKIDTLMADEGLTRKQQPRVRHLLDVLVNDVGADHIGKRVETPLAGLVVAPYYGCQCLRPFVVFDDPEQPVSMEGLITATGARIHSWTMGGRCCGASQMSTHPEAAERQVGAILRTAAGADAIVTVCPMCQMNLEAYQQKISRQEGEDLAITTLYLPQLLGLALGLDEKQLAMDRNLAVTSDFRRGAWAEPSTRELA